MTAPAGGGHVGGRGSSLRRLVVRNRSLSSALTPPHIAESNAFEMYRKVSFSLLAVRSTQVVVDLGAGAAWQHPAEATRELGVHLIGIDLDARALRENRALDLAVVADVSTAIPLAPSSVDLVTCHSAAEHFRDNAAMLREAFVVLRPGGRLVLQCPGSLAPFALLNRLLPRSWSRLLLHHLVPGSDGVLGHRAFYDRTRYSRLRDLAVESGFEVEYHFPGYFSAEYFAFFTPLYLVAHLSDLVRFAIGARDLASYNVFVLTRPGPRSGTPWDGGDERLQSTWEGTP